MIIHGNCIKEMRKMNPNSLDGLVTDPPYGLDFMGKHWDNKGTPRSFQRWCRIWATAAIRIMKPGAFGVVFSHPRTFHRMIVGLEDAGFEIRDNLMWLYASGFPKGPDISTILDDYLGLERKQGAMKAAPDGVPYSARQLEGHTMTTAEVYGETIVDPKKWFSTLPASDQAKAWEDYKTCLKPAWEPIILIRKPKEGTYAENILKWNVGALNIGGTRIPINMDAETDPRVSNQSKNFIRTTGVSDGGSTKFFEKAKVEGGYIQQMYDLKGRYPSNLVIDEMISELFDQISGVNKAGKFIRNEDVNRQERDEGLFSKENSGFDSSKQKGYSNYGDKGGLAKSFYICPTTNVVYGNTWAKRSAEHYGLRDGGGFGKFFYVPKASSSERNIGLGEFEPDVRDTTRNKPIDNPYNRNKPVKNKHPTVKPIKLMTYLVRLIKPPVHNPLILEPFGGSGSTYIACLIENCECVYIEQERDYIDILNARLDVPLKEYEKFTDSPIPPQGIEGQTSLKDYASWL